MKNRLLLKGFEVELFTGKFSGENVGISAEVAEELHGFVKEPDQRNLEYITTPEANYTPLKQALLAPRRTLRQWLAPKQLTLLPGSTLSLGDPKHFERSDPENPYHALIEQTYGSRVVTASVHINLGLNDLQLLFAALRLARCEAALFLALSASSPFLGGSTTGAHSQRWQQFPVTPAEVPLFLNHQHYVRWTEQQLATGTMWNERHLWTSVRPNGPERPYDINRLELRICDLITNPQILLAVTGLFELRVLSLLNRPDQFDPLQASSLSPNELAELSHANDMAAAQNSLNSTMHHWQDGHALKCRSWIAILIDEVMPLARELNLVDQLLPLQTVLNDGNQAMQWLQSVNNGHSVETVFQAGIAAMESEEQEMTKTKTPLG